MKKTSTLSLLFLIFFSIPILAQKRFTAVEAADSIQSVRGNARRLLNKEGASKQEIEQGIKLLNSAMLFLNNAEIKDLGEGNLYLKFRRADVTRELVYAYVLDHEYDKAIAALEDHFKLGTSTFILSMEKDADLKPIQSDPRFIAIMNKYRARIALWNGDGINTPYSANLSDAEKLAGLGMLWSQARANFVYFDHLTADWNKTYMDYIPQVQATKSTLEYYRVLQKFYAQLHDGHTNVYFPKEIRAEVNSRPPIKTELIEGRVFITAVYNDSLQKAGIIPGLEVTKIDNLPVKEYAATYVTPYQSASTPQDLDHRSYTYFLLSGAASKRVTLELKDRKGKLIIKTIPRSGYPAIKRSPAITYKAIGDIGYLTISNFEDDKIIPQFDSLFTTIDKTKGLIIDVRDNGGGNSGIGNEILGRLTDKPFYLFAHQNVRYDSRGGEPAWLDNGIAIGYPNRKHLYNKRVILLINSATFSAAEDFTVGFDAMKRGKLIGQTTGGSTGQPINFTLPGGGMARVCGRRETYPDGKDFVGVGIKPDILINTNIADLYNGTDAVLSKALELLK